MPSCPMRTDWHNEASSRIFAILREATENYSSPVVKTCCQRSSRAVSDRKPEVRVTELKADWEGSQVCQHCVVWRNTWSPHSSIVEDSSLQGLWRRVVGWDFPDILKESGNIQQITQCHIAEGMNLYMMLHWYYPYRKYQNKSGGKRAQFIINIFYVFWTVHCDISNKNQQNARFLQ